MVVTSRKTEKATILDLSGRLGLGEAVETFRNNFQELLASGEKNIAINLTGVPFIDSSGIGALVGAFTMAESKGAKCLFYGPSPQVKSALHVSRLEDILNPFSDEKSALAGLEAPSP
jgi:anti-sigma B factor antagonist